MVHRTLAICTFWATLAVFPAVAATCKSEIAVPQAVLEQRLVVLGELHGTRETAEFAGEYTCVLASGATEVTLALEIPEAEQARVSAYLDSQGSSADAGALLGGEFWNRPENRQDGRSSGAMFKLIERMRQLRSDGKRVSIIAIDGLRSGLKRDGAMAQIVRDHLQARPQARVVVLVGNVHALKGQGAFFDKDYESLAFLLSDMQPLTLNVVPKRGFAWVCIEGCGPRKITPQAWIDAKEPGVYVGQSPESMPRYHGTIVLEQAQASPPARAQ